MAPKTRGSKRAAGAAASPPPKSRKVDQPYSKYGCTPSHYEAVAEGVRRAEHLSEDCRSMLLAMAPHSICVPSDQRSHQQAMVVDMLGEVFKAVVAQLEAAVAEAAAGVAAVDASRSEQEQLVAKTEGATIAAEAAVQFTKAALAERTHEVAAARKALAERQDEQKNGDARSVAAEREKAVFEGCYNGEYKALKECAWEKPAECKKLFAAVDKVLKQLSLEESMVAALPGTLQRKERGDFDAMLLEQCESKLQGKIDELAAEIASTAPATAAWAAAVEAAQGRFTAAGSVQEAAAAELIGAQTALKVAKADLEVAKDEFAKTEPSKQQAVAVHEEKKAALDNFTYFNVETFSALKSRVAKKEEEPAVEEPKEAEAAPEAAPEAEVAA